MTEELTQRIKEICLQEQYKDCESLQQILRLILNNKKLNLKTIRELLLLRGSFNIPSYQRGYRWKEQQVKDLLEDIHTYAHTPPNKRADFYCLQPIVVQENGDKWDVIDGQQRLTTIKLILNVLKPESCNLKVEYERKENGGEGNDIDKDHISKARTTIEYWFKSKSDEEKECWLNTLLDGTKVIWYQVEKKEDSQKLKDSIDAFTRLNKGKIPLTNSEMIRALFILNCSKDTETEKEAANKEVQMLKRQKLAIEWDNLERELQNEDFWCFITLNNPFKKEYPNHIEYLFDLIENGGSKEQQDRYSTYRMYEKNIHEENVPGKNVSEEKVSECWLKIKQLYWRFHEWFVSDEIYHYLGFLWLVGGYSVQEAWKSAKGEKQSVFVKSLKTKIKKSIGLENVDFNTLSYREGYGEDNSLIQKILKLFNVCSHLQEQSRCPFLKYQNRIWSLEHIHAKQSKELKGEDWLKWAISQTNKKVLPEAVFKDKDLNEMIIKLKELNELKGKIDLNKSEDFKKLRTDFDKKIIELFGDISSIKDTIGNLALLGKNDNSSLSNDVFPVKRKSVLGFIGNKKYFVPIATKSVFLKQYSTKVDNMLKWEINDAKGYTEAICKCLVNFKIVVQNINYKTKGGC